MKNPLFLLIVWGSVLLLFMLSTVRKLFLAVLGLRHIRQKWLSNFPSSGLKYSVSQPVTELTNRCCGVCCHNINRRKRTASSPVSLLLSVYPAVCHFSQYTSFPFPCLHWTSLLYVTILLCNSPYLPAYVPVTNWCHPTDLAPSIMHIFSRLSG
jgi:hypothetical protein